MLFHPLPHVHGNHRVGHAPWLLRLMVFVLGGLLMWACACSATHDSGSHAHGDTPVSSTYLPVAAEAVEGEAPHEPHPHHGAVCVPNVVSDVLPQARKLFTGVAALATLAGVTAGVTAAIALQQQAARREGGRSGIRRSGRSTLSIVCRWRI
ncbi:hypothetical protein [Streptomyces sp. NPDC005004]